MRLADDGGPFLYRNDLDDRAVRARLAAGTTTAEVVRVYAPDDPYFARFGTYVHKTLAIPVRRFQVQVINTIALRSGPAPTDPVVAGPVAPGTALSALLAVTTTGVPQATWVGTPAGPPALPAVTGPHDAGAQHRYQVALAAEPPEENAQLQVRSTFTDPARPAPARRRTSTRRSMSSRSPRCRPPRSTSPARGRRSRSPSHPRAAGRSIPPP